MTNKRYVVILDPEADHATLAPEIHRMKGVICIQEVGFRYPLLAPRYKPVYTLVDTFEAPLKPGFIARWVELIKRVFRRP